jgi:uroporphyrinogen decarboxylase
MPLRNDLLLRVLNGESVDRPPVWMMRQAGRILPQYRAVRESLSGFIELVKNPELVAEVTIQPVDELDVDAAIIFSDILVIPEAMGLPYEMVEARGPYFPNTINNLQDINKLIDGDEAAANLEYVYAGVRETKAALNDRVPLIGFAGAPFTLFCYMVEGKGSKTFSKAKKMMYLEPALTHTLLQKITNTIISYLHKKIDAGAQVLQIFDSWAGVLDEQTYNTFCIPYLLQISDALKDRVPVILFPKGAWFSLSELDKIGSQGIGIDWNIPAKYVRQLVGETKILQGNLDPCVLYGDKATIKKTTKQMIDDFGKNYIANLGHGVYPDTPLDNAKVFIEAVKEYRY